MGAFVPNRRVIAILIILLVAGLAVVWIVFDPISIGRAKYHHAQGRKVAEAGRLPESVAEFSKALELDPNTPLPLAEKAVELAPDSPDYLDTLARALAESGRLEEALKTQERALELAELSGNSELKETLAEYYEELKRQVGRK